MGHHTAPPASEAETTSRLVDVLPKLCRSESLNISETDAVVAVALGRIRSGHSEPADDSPALLQKVALSR